LLPGIDSGCIFRQIFGPFYVNCFHCVREVFFYNLSLSSGLGFNGVCFWVMQGLEACSRLSIIVFKDFLMCLLGIGIDHFFVVSYERGCHFLYYAFHPCT